MSFQWWDKLNVAVMNFNNIPPLKTEHSSFCKTVEMMWHNVPWACTKAWTFMLKLTYWDGSTVFLHYVSELMDFVMLVLIMSLLWKLMPIIEKNLISDFREGKLSWLLQGWNATEGQTCAYKVLKCWPTASLLIFAQPSSWAFHTSKLSEEL